MTPHRLSQFTIGVVIACILAAIGSVCAQQVTATWSGGTGNWNDPLQWSSFPLFPNNNGILTYSTVINPGNVTLNQDITVSKLALGQSGSPTLEGNGGFILNVDSNLIVNQGSITGDCTLNAL